MKINGQSSQDDFDGSADRGRGPYDPAPVDADDLWFLPGDTDAGGLELLPPGPRRDRGRLFDPVEWRAAQDALSGPLADLAVTFGALDERLRSGPPEACAGWRQRLALLEVADLGWWTGERIGIERLALWVGARLGSVADDAQALARAGWAVRRLQGGPGPEAGGWAVGLTAFLGRSVPEAVRSGPAQPANAPGECLSAERVEPTVPEAVADLAEVMAGAGGLHPVTQAAILFHAWRMLGPETAGRGPVQDVEASALAARHGAAMGRSGGALFLPLALTGPTALRATGAVPERLARWIAGATQATLAALLHLDRIRDWQVRAGAETRDLSGRTPPALVAALAAWPMLSAPMAETLTGASRAAVQRNLDTFAARGLIREVTGQGRYRVWAAAI